MEGMTGAEIVKLTNKYLGVTDDGYLCDFTYQKHKEFYPLFCDLDINPEHYSGSTRARFQEILRTSPPHAQAKIIRGVLAKCPRSPGTPYGRKRIMHQAGIKQVEDVPLEDGLQFAEETHRVHQHRRAIGAVCVPSVTRRHDPDDARLGTQPGIRRHVGLVEDAATEAEVERLCRGSDVGLPRPLDHWGKRNRELGQLRLHKLDEGRPVGFVFPLFELGQRIDQETIDGHDREGVVPIRRQGAPRADVPVRDPLHERRHDVRQLRPVDRRVEPVPAEEAVRLYGLVEHGR